MTIIEKICSDPSIIRKHQHDHINHLISKGVCTGAGDVNERQLSLLTLEFKKVIEENANSETFMKCLTRSLRTRTLTTRYGINMRTVIPRSKMTYSSLPSLAGSFAPTYSYASPLVSGVPMYGVLAPFCNTKAGYRAFTNTKVINAMFHRTFNEWTRFLVSPASRDVLVAATAGSWFSPDVLHLQEARLGMPFAKAWRCYPDQPHMGFISWDDFISEKAFDLPIAPDEPKLIDAACEAITSRVATNVQATDNLWKNVPGTYYAARLDDDLNPDVLKHSSPPCMRALIFIESDNPATGLMCFVAVGLGKASTCKIGVFAPVPS